jgi:hypothetical protein
MNENQPGSGLKRGGVSTKQKSPVLRRGFSLHFGFQLHSVEAGIDLAEDITDDRAEDHESRDNNDSNQNKNQRIFDQTLTFFLG